MKSSTSCRVCRRWLEGEWNRLHSLRRVDRLTEGVQEELDALQRQMDQGHCDGCTPWEGPRIWPPREVTVEEPPFRPVSGRTEDTYDLRRGVPVLAGPHRLAVVLDADRRATVHGTATTKWWELDQKHTRALVEGTFMAVGLAGAVAFRLECVYAPARGASVLHCWMSQHQGVEYRTRRGRVRTGAVAVSVSLLRLDAPPVMTEPMPPTTLLIQGIGMRFGRLPL